MAIVGAFARVDSSLTDICKGELNELSGVSTFELGDPDKVGILVEAETLNEAHQAITTTIRSATGVMGVWPVYINTEDEQEQYEHVGTNENA